MVNGRAESINGRFRDEFLNTEPIGENPEAQVLADHWRLGYTVQAIIAIIGAYVPGDSSAGAAA
jgi:putative transposase